jgi:hypothetical protein
LRTVSRVAAAIFVVRERSKTRCGVVAGDIAVRRKSSIGGVLTATRVASERAETCSRVEKAACVAKECVYSGCSIFLANRVGMERCRTDSRIVGT